MYIHPVLTYGEELLITASNSVNNELVLIQNKALRTICGGVKFTPITAMEMFTDIKTIQFSREEAALKTYERIIRTPNSLWNNFVATEQRLKSKYSFVNKIELLQRKYELNLPEKVGKFTNKKQSKLRNIKFNESKTMIKQNIKNAIKLHNDELSEGKLWSNINAKTVKSNERQTYVANFRKITGHDLLYKHLNRMKVVPSPLCIFCQIEDQTSEHILNCTGLKTEIENLKKTYSDEEELFSKLYWYVRGKQ